MKQKLNFYKGFCPSVCQLGFKSKNVKIWKCDFFDYPVNFSVVHTYISYNFKQIRFLWLLSSFLLSNCLSIYTPMQCREHIITWKKLTLLLIFFDWEVASYHNTEKHKFGIILNNTAHYANIGLCEIVLKRNMLKKYVALLFNLPRNRHSHRR